MLILRSVDGGLLNKQLCKCLLSGQHLISTDNNVAVSTVVIILNSAGRPPKTDRHSSSSARTVPAVPGLQTLGPGHIFDQRFARL